MNHKAAGLVWRAWALGLALTLLFAASLVHRDLDRGKAPFHCTACAASVVSSHPQKPRIFDGAHLADAGRVSADVMPIRGVVLPARSTGRSPPAA